MKTSLMKFLAVVLFLGYGCAAVPYHAASPAKFADVLKAYPQTIEPLAVQPLQKPFTGPAFSRRDRTDVYIIVHPAYAFFIDQELNDVYSEAKWGLMKQQFETEAKFIRDQAQRGNAVVLVLPAGSVPPDTASSYVTYLNKTTMGSRSVFYLYSTTRESGYLTPESMALFCGFLQAKNARKVMIGGGYIGRCQGELFGQIAEYCDTTDLYIVPEISTISPADISEEDAADILKSIQHRDYTPVGKLISKKTKGDFRLMSIPQTREVERFQ